MISRHCGVRSNDAIQYQIIDFSDVYSGLPRVACDDVEMSPLRYALVDMTGFLRSRI